jgi:hypothetical protein
MKPIRKMIFPPKANLIPAISLNRLYCRTVLDCGSPLPLFHRRRASQNGSGLPPSKTLARGSLPFRFRSAGAASARHQIEQEEFPHER